MASNDKISTKKQKNYIKQNSSLNKIQMQLASAHVQTVVARGLFLKASPWNFLSGA